MSGLATVLLPARNLKDLRDVPESVRATLQFVALVDDAVRAALAEAGARRPAPEVNLV
ncbi:S16 family serine protease [Variovorax soli]|uniref:S16 family serine protease n=1 Tax=Variovorax soli TaxID=376815 RepID=UPI00286BF80B|nr:S16 family serine protease [Variovorax soli]